MKSTITIILILCAVFTLQANDETVYVTDFTLPDLAGNMVTLSEFEGLIVLDFWASWCPPCRDEVPVLQRLYDEYKEQGLHIIGISNEDVITQKRFKEDMVEQDVAMDYTLLVDIDRTVFGDYKIQGIPTTIFIRDDLSKIYKEIGFTIEYEDKFREIIKNNLPD